MPYDNPTSISNGISAAFHGTRSGGTGSGVRTADKVFSSKANLDERTQGFPSRTAAEFRVAECKAVVVRALDKSLLLRARDILESFDANDLVQSSVDLESLRGIVVQLWESAANSTQFHQQILAILESAILTIELPNQEQLSLFREAVIDLGHDVLTQAQVDIIQRQFISKGFSPLALLGDTEDSDGSG